MPRSLVSLLLILAALPFLVGCPTSAPRTAAEVSCSRYTARAELVP